MKVPRYDYRCQKCLLQFEEFSRLEERDMIRCPRCGGETERKMVYPFGAHIWKPQWFEHIDTKPIYIESKKQLKRECERRGLIPIGL